tara:strand:- start:451 stop:858 length:408 start_codon:yes stop_codon:yes gene_type:complete
MELDKKYLKKLKLPLKGKLGLQVSQYFDQLENKNIDYEESKSRLSEKFIEHMNYLLREGIIIGPHPEKTGLQSLGLKVGANRNTIIISNGLIRLIEPSKFIRLILWIRDHILLTIFTGIIITITSHFILKALNLG